MIFGALPRKVHIQDAIVLLACFGTGAAFEICFTFCEQRHCDGLGHLFAQLIEDFTVFPDSHTTAFAICILANTRPSLLRLNHTVATFRALADNRQIADLTTCSRRRFDGHVLCHDFFKRFLGKLQNLGASQVTILDRVQLFREVHGDGNIQNNTKLIHNFYQLEPGGLTIVDTLLEGDILALDAAVYRIGAGRLSTDGGIGKDFFPFLVGIFCILFFSATHRRYHPVIEGFDRIPFWRSGHLPYQLEVYIDCITLVELRQHLVAARRLLEFTPAGCDLHISFKGKVFIVAMDDNGSAVYRTVFLAEHGTETVQDTLIYGFLSAT